MAGVRESVAIGVSVAASATVRWISLTGSVGSRCGMKLLKCNHQIHPLQSLTRLSAIANRPLLASEPSSLLGKWANFGVQNSSKMSWRYAMAQRSHDRGFTA